ncbi:MAG: 4a-hydroxytetrahydrobiopterin dehydratase [Polyangiales bacterium]
MQRLSDDVVRHALETLPRWSGDGRAIAATFGFDTYEAGVAFAIQIALLAQRMDHHPELIIGWRRVTVTYTTHDAGGVTARDLAAVNAVDAIAPPT